MLKGIHPLLIPPLLNVLAEMGHGDELCIVDANFPATAKARRIVHIGGIPSPRLLEAVLTVFPLDTFVEAPAAVMTPPEGRPPIISEFQSILDAAEARPIMIEDVERHAFYRRAADSFAILQSGELRWWGNILIRKDAIKS